MNPYPLSAISLAVVMLATAGTATAQVAPAPGAPASAAADKPAAKAETQVESITVTARRRKERLLDVPLTVQTVTGAQIETLGINDPLSLTLAAPTLQVGDQNVYAVRGVGTLSSGGNPNLEGAVALAIDGVNLGRAVMGNLLFADIENIEVLSGPQGTLFGKNATAGLVNITTTRPVLGATEGQMRVDLSRRTSGTPGNGATVQGVYNLPVGATAALRVNLFGTKQDALVEQRGPVTGSDLGESQRGAKLKYRWDLTPRLNVYLIADHVERHGVAGTPYARTWRALGTGSPLSGLLAQDGITPGPDNTVAQADSPSKFDFRTSGLQAEVNYDLGGGYSLTNILAHRRYAEYQLQDGDGTRVDGLNVVESDRSFRQTSNELRMLSPRNQALDWQAGLYVFRSTLDRRTDLRGQLGLPFRLVPGSSYNVGGHSTGTLNNTSAALFGQGTYKVNEALRLTAGLRYTRDRNDYTLSQDPTGIGAVVFTPRLTPDPLNVKANANDWSYRVGPQWYLNDDTMTYVTYAKGFKGPGFNDTTTQADIGSLAVRPETVKSLEAGVKTALFARRLQLSLSIFRQEFTDLQVQSLNTVTNSFVTQNSARALSQGAELQVTARPTPAWRISGALTLLDAKFKDFSGAQCYIGQPGCGTNGTFNAAGIHMPAAPRTAASAQIEYRSQLSNSYGLVYDANVYHRSNVNYSLNGAPGMALPSATTVGFGIALSNADAGWTARLYCRNCFDERVPMSLSPDAAEAAGGRASYLQQWGYGSFRTVGVTFDYRF